MTLGHAAARRFSLAAAFLLLVSVAPAAAAVNGKPASPYSTLGHGWLSVNTNLRSPSHISAWSIDEYLARNTALHGLGHAFKAAEKKYDVNALYLLAHAMHETDFGTSFIAQHYHNLFGWNAIDSDPTGFATRFRTFAAGIDFVTSQISESYLSPTGRFYGGAATLRGMHHYASDPDWAMLIARIANGIVLPTLAKRDITFADPVVGDGSAGKALAVAVEAAEGDLPDGLEMAYRFVPVAVVEAGAAARTAPEADPEFRLAKGESADGRIRATVTAPRLAGRYRLELQLRDSDGTELTEYGVPEIPDATVRVYGSDAVSYAVTTTGAGLAITVTNEGTRAIPASGAGAIGPAGTIPTTVPTILSAWLIGPGGAPSLIARVPFAATLKPGASWTADIAAPDAALLQGVLLVRVEVGGAPSRLGGSPPGVFRVDADGSALKPDPATSPDPSATVDPAPSAPPAGPTPSASSADPPALGGLPLPAPSVDPSAAAAAAAGAAEQAVGASVAAAQTASPGPPPGPGTLTGAPADGGAPTPVLLTVGEITPLDAVTRVLLNPAWKPTPPAKAGAKTAGAKAAVGGTATAGVVQLSYQPLLSPLTPGTAILRMTNSGTAPLLAALPPDPLAPPSPAPPATEADGTAAGAPGTVLRVTAIPAWGPATEPIELTVPLLVDVDPGRSVDVGIALPPTAGGQSSYLVLARVIGADGRSYPATVFWLRGAPPGVATHAAVAAPGLAPTGSPAPPASPTATPTSQP